MRHAGNWLVQARGAEWVSFAKRYVPWIVGGWIVGYIIWPLRVVQLQQVLDARASASSSR